MKKVINLFTNLVLDKKELDVTSCIQKKREERYRIWALPYDLHSSEAIMYNSNQQFEHESILKWIGRSKD